MMFLRTATIQVYARVNGDGAQESHPIRKVVTTDKIRNEKRWEGFVVNEDKRNPDCGPKRTMTDDDDNRYANLARGRERTRATKNDEVE